MKKTENTNFQNEQNAMEFEQNSKLETLTTSDDADNTAKDSTDSLFAQKVKTRHIAAATAAKVAILTALSWVLYMFVKFPLPTIFPSFLEMQISDLPALLGGFALGPIWGALIIVLKCVLKMPFSSTACVGEIADILIGLAFVLTASLIYKYKKTKKGAFWGLLSGIFASVFVAVLMNWAVLVPFYVEMFFGGNFNAILGVVSPLYHSVTKENFYFWYLLVGVLPFNLLRCTICGGLTFAVYKSISKVLHW